MNRPRSADLSPCALCRTIDGCNRHQVFTCGTCGQLTYFYDGGGDDRPDDCSECWAKWHAAMHDVASGFATRLEQP